MKFNPYDTYFGRSLPLKEYISTKIHMLETEFYIKLTPEEIDHIHSLEDKNAVDRYAHQLFMDRL